MGRARPRACASRGLLKKKTVARSRSGRAAALRRRTGRAPAGHLLDSRGVVTPLGRLLVWILNRRPRTKETTCAGCKTATAGRLARQTCPAHFAKPTVSPSPVRRPVGGRAGQSNCLAAAPGNTGQRRLSERCLEGMEEKRIRVAVRICGYNLSDLLKLSRGDRDGIRAISDEPVEATRWPGRRNPTLPGGGGTGAWRPLAFRGLAARGRGKDRLLPRFTEPTNLQPAKGAGRCVGPSDAVAIGHLLGSPGSVPHQQYKVAHNTRRDSRDSKSKCQLVSPVRSGTRRRK